MNGGADSDTYYLDSTDVLSDSGGTDTVITALNGLTLGAGLLTGIENLTLTGAAVSGTGSSAANVIVGNANNNSLLGLAGNDTLYGDDGDDAIFGGEGVDWISGGAGSDTMTGGTSVLGDNDAAAGNNFIFDTSPFAGDIDKIEDFCADRDKIWLDPDFFAVFVTPATDAQPVGNAFLSGATTPTPTLFNHRLLFNQTTGALYYDADGNGAGAAVQFAIIEFQSGVLDVTDFRNVNNLPAGI
jgi:serralysin